MPRTQKVNTSVRIRAQAEKYGKVFQFPEKKKKSDTFVTVNVSKVTSGDQREKCHSPLCMGLEAS